MNNLNISALAIALGFAFSSGAMAEGISKVDYQAGKDKIAADYKVAKSSCGSLSGNTKDICVAEAKGNEKVAKADLAASYQPSTKTRYEALVAKAEAAYAVAKERCDDQAGNAKDVCVKEAKAAKTTALADAKAQMKTAEAKTTARETSADARKDATDDKVNADYAVAKEKCDAFAGSAKSQCLDQAKAKFGK
ncbi:MAG: hypothetical protein HGA75_07190 [Thiobacillus sp.]|nr:hypothetical protein [Thiobacillus sp.]